MYMQVPLFNIPQPMTTTVTSPAALTCTTGNCSGYSIPFSSIGWTVSPAPSGTYAAFDLQDGVFVSGGGTQTLLNFTLINASGTAGVASTMNFYYTNTVAQRYPHLATGVRGRGLLLGLVLTERGVEQGMSIVQQMFEQGALINFAGNTVLRFVPPLIVSTEEIDQLIDRLCLIFDRLG